MASVFIKKLELNEIWEMQQCCINNIVKSWSIFSVYDQVQKLCFLQNSSSKSFLAISIFFWLVGIQVTLKTNFSHCVLPFVPVLETCAMKIGPCWNQKGPKSRSLCQTITEGKILRKTILCAKSANLPNTKFCLEVTTPNI